YLVLDMDGGGAGILEAAHHVHHVESLAVAGVAVDHDGKSARPRNLSDEEADVVDRQDAEVRDAHGGGHGGPGEIESREAGLLGLKCRHPVMGARNLENPRTAEQFSEPRAGSLGGKVGCENI